MRIVMMGTGPFAVPVFRALVESEHDVPALFTQPSRGKPGSTENPTRSAAEALGVEIIAEADVNETLVRERLQSLAADLLVVCDFGQILSADTLGASRLGGINLHGSYLPKYRGAAPIQWALYNGDATTGVSVIHMTPRLDAGPCLVQTEELITADDDAVSLELRLSQLGIAAVFESIAKLHSWNGSDSIGSSQDKRLATRAPRLKKSDGRIDWRRTAEEIDRQRRAFTPWPGTFTFVPRSKGDPVRVIIDSSAALCDASTDATPGTVIRAEKDQLHVACGDESVLAIYSVQPAGKRPMDVAEYLRGRPLAVADQLS